MKIRFGYDATRSELARLKELLQRKVLLILTGPCGAGKGTIATALLNDRSLGIKKVRLHVSKPAKATPDHDDEYFYVSQSTFEAKRRAGEFLQWQEVSFSGWYGISTSVLFSTLQRSSCTLVDIGTEATLGLSALLRQHSIPHLPCFISPVALATLDSSEGVTTALSVLKNRMLQRNRGEIQRDLQGRLETANTWLRQAAQLPFHVVENTDGNQDDVYRQVSAMVRTHLEIQ